MARRLDRSTSGVAFWVGVIATLGLLCVGATAQSCGCTARQKAAMFWPTKSKEVGSSGSSSGAKASFALADRPREAVRIDDMLIPVEDFESSSASASAGKSSLATQPTDYINCVRLWPGGKLYYRFSYSYPSGYKSLIRQAISRLESETGNRVQFIELGASTSGVAHVNIVNSDGCWSYVGKIYSYSAQDLSLAVPGCMLESIVQHEFIHALGFYHEQSRFDRDSYVSIQWGNIESENCNNFYKNSYLIPSDFPGYDYGSIMHYTSDAFACNSSQPTLVTTTGDLISERTNLSTTDVSKLTYVYSTGNLAYCSVNTSSYSQTTTTPRPWEISTTPRIAPLPLSGSTVKVNHWLSVICCYCILTVTCLSHCGLSWASIH